MDRGNEIEWCRFKGTIKGECAVATIEMMDLYEPNWVCRINSLVPNEVEYKVKQFKEGELEEATSWCRKQIKETNDRKNRN